MEKKKEVLRAILSLILLAVIITLIMLVIFLLMQGLDAIGISFGYFSSIIITSVNGVLMGIGIGFGFVIAKRLFDITIFDK